ncbi:hypothetical protein LAZ67_21001470 [Cordylochernes scorpioides]|uniref:Peptidase aspartic putative domain-containing protein n=1 Tax=Cordylochernes scorpioides TaxID=51811 RepID=A0ABY6LM25_9ARAC|nr:hypothetical protein LAZ67_21001470 [Cordylochernes scorpioides]
MSREFSDIPPIDHSYHNSETLAPGLRGIEEETRISKSLVGSIIKEDLQLKKTPSKFVPKMLTIQQKENRVEVAKKMLEMVKENPNWKEKVITGDETWVYGSIDQNPTLGNYQKLQYLNFKLKGNAARLISAFNISDENYPIAWQTLVNRFDKKSELAFKQIQNLYDLKNVKQESTKYLLDLLDTCNESIQNLSILGLERNNLSDMILIHIIQSKLDRSIRKEWEMSLLEKEYPSYEKMISFLERFAGSLGSFQNKENSKQFCKMNKSTHSHSATFASDSSIDSRVKSCVLCKGEHFLLKCPRFNGMMLPERWTFVKDNRLCYNCLRSNHRVSSCVFTQNCKSCNKRHHTLLHQFKPEMLSPVADISPLTHASVSCFANNKSHDRILLSTALIKVKSANWVLQTCRALINTDSQRCLITNSCRKKLNIPLAECKTTVFGLGNKLVEQSMGEVSLQFSPHFSNLIFNANPIVIDKITSELPNFFIEKDNWPYLKNLLLADPNFDKSSQIDLVIGAELAPCLFNGKVRFQNLSGPTACGSKLEWLLTCKILLSGENSNQYITMFASEEQDDFLKIFWELESVPSAKYLTREEISCEEIYINSLKILEDERYSVGLPFRTLPTLGESWINALKRFLSLERKFKNIQPDFLLGNGDQTSRRSFLDFQNSWIKSESRHWKPFVGNRIAEVQRLTLHSSWHYVISKDNPADCASRGITPSELVDHSLWWRGPTWLSDVNFEDPIQTQYDFPKEISDGKFAGRKLIHGSNGRLSRQNKRQNLTPSIDRRRN